MEAITKMAENDTLSLLSRVRDGDNFAFELLLKKYRALVDNASRSAQKELEASSLSAEFSLEDLTQEAQLALYRAAMSYDADKVADNVTFGLYAKICVRNAMISQLRRAASKRRRRERTALKEAYLASHGTGGDADDSNGKFTEKLLESGGDEVLSRYERDVLMLYLQGKSNSEIARSVGRDTKSVSNAIYRIKVKLKGLSK